MAAEEFSIISGQTFTQADVTPSKHIYISPDQNNSSGYNSLRLVVEYSNFQNLGGVSLQAVVETKSAGGEYFPIAYQFDPFAEGHKEQRIMILQPDMVWLDAGIDNNIYVANQNIARISHQQGKLGPNFRVCVNLIEPTPGNFTSVDISIYGERYNAQ